MLPEKLKSRICIICGHYGAGKTNVAVNLAKALAKAGERVCLADIDTVNPYFRAADNVNELESLGVRCIIPRYANTNVDIPCLPAEFQSVFHSDERCIIDVGGDDGAAAVSVYRDAFAGSGFDMLYVYNAFRPLTSDLDSALASLRFIEKRAGLSVTGIVDNSNLGAETTARNVADGEKKCLALCRAAGLPLLAGCAFKNVSGLADDGLFLMENATKQLF